MTYEVGRYYMVPCVRGNYFDIDGDWPVLGNFHEDSEHIGFHYWHYHIDVRFLSKRMFDRLSKLDQRREKQTFARGSPLMVHPNSERRPYPGHFSKEDHPRPVLRRRLCNRQWAYSRRVEMAKWISPLEKAYSNATLAKGHCPHRGADLSTLPVDAAGCVECPLHGLVFNATTGAMVPRAEWNHMLALAEQPKAHPDMPKLAPKRIKSGDYGIYEAGIGIRPHRSRGNL